MIKEKLIVNSKKCKNIKFNVESSFISSHAITLISLVITIILLIILAGVAINLSLGKNGIFNRAKEGTEKYKIEQIREKVEIGILDSELQRISVNEKLTIEGALQDLVESKIFDSIDKEEKLGYIGEYEVKLKYNEENRVVIEYIQIAEGIRVNYILDPVGYTNTSKVNILFKVQGKVKSVTTPKGLIVYPKNGVVAIDHEVTANGNYKFIIEKEDGNILEKGAIVDTIDTLPPKDFTITAENTGTGFIITTSVEDAEATETSVKSGIEKIEYYAKLTAETEYTKYETGNIENLQQGEYNIYAIAYDRANNKTQTKVITAKVMDPLVEMYGRNVNYSVVVNGITLNNWKVFYINKDTKDTFLLYGDYLPIGAIPTDSTKIKISTTFPYVAEWERKSPMAIQGDWVTHRELFMATKFTLNNTSPSAGCASTLLNTNNWTNFVDTNYADLAIGSPTIEMFIESWNSKGYTNLNISTDQYGYLVNGIRDMIQISKSSEIYDKLYFPRNVRYGGAYGTWLAAPTQNKSGYINMWGLFSTGDSSTRINQYNVGYTMSIRPVVHLKNGENGVELKWNSETNKYDIMQK